MRNYAGIMRKISIPLQEPDFGTTNERALYALYRDLREAYNELVDDVLDMVEYVQQKEQDENSDHRK